MSEGWVGTWGVVIGAVLGFGLTEISRWLERNNRAKGHWAVLRAEVEECADLAKTYIDSNIQSPLYRLPRDAYTGALPDLIATNSISTGDAAALRAFYGSVDQLNRGLDAVANEVSRGNSDRATAEHERNRVKARRIWREGENYAGANRVLTERLV